MKKKKIKKTVKVKKVAAKKTTPKKVVAKKTVVKKVTAKRKPVAAKATVLPKSDERIGLYGGAFNPIHAGHLNAALTVKGELKLDKVYFVPAFKAPHREIVGPSAQDRAALISAAIKNYEDELGVSDIEIQRKGISFTVDTLREYNKTHKAENIYFIVGADAFKHLHTWREFSELMKLANFVVTTRPGTEISFFDLNEEIQNYVKGSDLKKLTLKTKRFIHLVELEDINASSTDIRKRLRSGGDVKNMVPPQVLDIINEKGFYKRSVPAVKDYKEFSLFCANSALDKKALSLKVYDMTKLNAYSDFSVICSGTSTRHTAAVAENVIERVKEEYGLHPIGFEGARDGHWVLIDYGAVVVHVFEDAERLKYKIEELWKSCPQVQ